MLSRKGRGLNASYDNDLPRVLHLVEQNRTSGDGLESEEKE